MLVGLALFTEAHRLDWSGHIVGDLMMVCAAFGLAANAFVNRHILKTMDIREVAFIIPVLAAWVFWGWRCSAESFPPCTLPQDR